MFDVACSAMPVVRFRGSQHGFDAIAAGNIARLMGFNDRPSINP